MAERPEGDFLSLPLNQVCFPAAHDAGMCCGRLCIFPAAASQTQTQTLDLAGQLNVGVRFFDLRPTLRRIPRMPKGKYEEVLTEFGHFTNDLGCYGQDIAEALQQIKRFSEQCPGELILLKFRLHNTKGHHLDAKWQDKCIALVRSELGETMHRAEVGEKIGNKTIMDLLAQKRNVICLFSNFDDGKYAPKEGVLRYGDHQDANLDILDDYSASTEAEQMVFDQRRKYFKFVKELRSKPRTDGKMFLWSHTLTQSTAGAISSTFGLARSVLELADDANAILKHTIARNLEQSSWFTQPPNFIYVDKVDAAHPVWSAMFVNLCLEGARVTHLAGGMAGLPFHASWKDGVTLRFATFDSVLIGGLQVEHSDGSSTRIAGQTTFPQPGKHVINHHPVKLAANYRITKAKLSLVRDSKGLPAVEAITLIFNHDDNDVVELGLHKPKREQFVLEAGPGRHFCGISGRFHSVDLPKRQSGGISSIAVFSGLRFQIAG